MVCDQQLDYWPEPGGSSYSLSFMDLNMRGVHTHEPIVASLATLPERIGSLHDTIASLLAWANRVNVFVNGSYRAMPQVLGDPRIEVLQNGINIGDQGKFYWTRHTKRGYHFICDDDLIYSPRYAELMIEKIEEYQRRAIVGVHGSVLIPTFDDYYSGDREVFSFTEDKPEDRRVDFLGTGAIAFHAAGVEIPFEVFDKPNMADVILGVFAKRSRIPLVCVESPGTLVAKGYWAQKRSIYEHSSSNAIDSPFNVRAAANHYLKSHWIVAS